MAIIQSYVVLAAGGADIVNYQQMPDSITIDMNTDPMTLLGNYSINTSSSPPLGTSWTVYLDLRGLDLNGNSFSVFGQSITADMQTANTIWLYYFQIIPAGLAYSLIPFDMTTPDILSGEILLDGTLPISKLEALTSAQIIVGNGSNIPTAVAVTGDIAITNAGVTSISAGAIVNADVNAAAAIARTKIANGTASHVVINDGSGTLSSEAQLAKTRGGFGTDVSASTGFTKFSSGTLSISSITEVITVEVSFEAAGGTVPSVGDFKIILPYACTVTSMYAYATKAIANTDAATIQLKNNAGTSATGGLITFAASDARGTAYTVSPSANNTYSANDVLTLSCAKTTAGGYALVSITITRTS